jgi:hypothetical protein
VTIQQVIELALAAALFALGVWQYRRRSAEGEAYGSQSAVLLFIVAIMVAIHGLALLDYRPSPAELGQ